MLEILGSPAPLSILELFYKNPQKEFYTKKISKKLGLSKATTIKWLKKLRDEGILIEFSKGRKKIYRLRWGDPISRQIRVLFTLTELLPELREISDLRAAYLIGNSARGSDPPDSPIELLILTRHNAKRVQDVLKDVSSEINRVIEAKIMTPLEYAELSKRDPRLHERLEREKVRLIFPRD